MDFNDIRRHYQEAEPFPHIVCDEYFDEYDLDMILEDFPKPDSSWWKYDNALERKLAKNRDLPHSIQEFIQMLQSNPFVSFLEYLTGITNLIVDHTLNGGGLHQIPSGGKLDVHEDYNYHPLTKLDRRLNVLIYLNKDWKTEWGGNLELWDQEMKKCEKQILPIFNRMVIFSTNPGSFHGHPHPLECPITVTRKSIAMYYYTNGRPEHEKRPSHSTLFQKLPGEIENPELEALRQKRGMGRL